MRLAPKGNISFSQGGVEGGREGGPLKVNKVMRERYGAGDEREKWRKGKKEEEERGRGRKRDGGREKVV